MFTKVENALEWMEERRFITKGMDKFQAYMKELGNPQDEIPCVHIAGTNGKGSTLHYTSQMLQSAGYKVGTFTSPYLETHFDRICINDQTIDKQVFLDIVNKHQQAWIEHEFNMFEIDFVIASLYFQIKKPDFVLYEVGLGGRNDATNVVQPLVSVITNIGMDHMELLGDTYEKIAKEKAGIIKHNVPLITAERKTECLHVFQTTCLEKNSPYIACGDSEYNLRNHTLQFLYKDTFVKLSDTPIYQEANIRCALEIIYYMKKQGLIKISSLHIQKGLQNSHWKGRFEIVHKKPIIILDGAHNKEGIEALCASMSKYENIHVIFSALKDKEYDVMIEKLQTISEDITVCEFNYLRATNCEELAKHHSVFVVKDYQQAIKQAMMKEGTILITGSLYFISEVRKYILEMKK